MLNVILQRLEALNNYNLVSSCNTDLFMICKSIALTKITGTNLCAFNLWKGTQVQLDRLDGLVLSKTQNAQYY